MMHPVQEDPNRQSRQKKKNKIIIFIDLHELGKRIYWALLDRLNYEIKVMPKKIASLNL